VSLVWIYIGVKEKNLPLDQKKHKKTLIVWISEGWIEMCTTKIREHTRKSAWTSADVADFL